MSRPSYRKSQCHALRMHRSSRTRYDPRSITTECVQNDHMVDTTGRDRVGRKCTVDPFSPGKYSITGEKGLRTPVTFRRHELRRSLITEKSILMLSVLSDTMLTCLELPHTKPHTSTHVVLKQSDNACSVSFGAFALSQKQTERLPLASLEVLTSPALQ